MTPEARRRFLAALLASDLIGVLVLVGVYVGVSVPVFVWMSRSTQRKVEESQRRYSSS